MLFTAVRLTSYYWVPAAAKSLQSCLTLCDLIDGSPPGAPVPGILQARILEWVAISFSSTWKWKWSCSVVSNSSKPHGLQPTSVHGIFQARVLEWVAIAFSILSTYNVQSTLNMKLQTRSLFSFNKCQHWVSKVDLSA